MDKKRKKIISLIALIVIVVIWVGIAALLGKPVIEYVETPKKFREWVQGYGMFGYLICIGISAMQIVMPGIPSTPVAVGAGYVYGIVVGTILYMIGFTIGCSIVFVIVRKLGQKFVEIFFPMEKIKSLKFLHNKHKRIALVFFIYLLPGTPKSLIAYFMGLTDIELKSWIWIATIARMPSIVIYAVGGNAVGEESYIKALLVMIVFAMVTLAGAFIYRNILALIHRNQELKK